MDAERQDPDVLEAPVEPLEGPAERREDEEPVDAAPAKASNFAETPRTATWRKTEHTLESEREQREATAEKGIETRCLVARTALVIPLSTPEEDDGPLCLSAAQTRARVESYLGRRVINPDGELTPMWRVQELPREVHDLSPHFRQLLGYVTHHDGGPRLRSWRTYRLKLRKEIRTTLFSRATVWSYDLEGNPVKYTCRISSVELIVFPLGTPIFSIKIDWLPAGSSSLSLAQVRTRLYVSKFRAQVARVNSGWTFTPEINAHARAAFQSHLGSLGMSLAGAIYDGRPISLGEFAEALCAPQRVSGLSDSKPRERHCYHHSIVLLASPLPDEALYSSLFHLRRAYGQKNRPPPPPSRHALASYDRVLIPRGNRYIGLSREGSICLTWLDGRGSSLSEGSSWIFESQIWPHKWMGIYFVLGIHALGERESLEEISFLTALEADDISLTPDEASLWQTKEARYRLRSLAAVLVRFTLSMSSSDCGGLSEYSEYFRALRDCFGIAERRAELDDEISHVQAMVDTYYLQEKRRVEARKVESREISQRYVDKLQRLDDRYRQRVDLVVALLTSLALPLAVASSLWGMNNEDLPKIPWWSVIAGALLLSAVLFIGISIILIRRRLAYERYSAKLKKKMKRKLESNDAEDGTSHPPRSDRRGSASSFFGLPPAHRALYGDGTATA